MSYGYTGKILEINLTTGTCNVLEMGEAFYRKYLGGPAIATYFALKEIAPRTEALCPENVLVFATGILTGTFGPAVPRYTVCAKSPLTDTIGKSEAGGFWGPELKKAGFDAIVVKGKAKEPVYVNIVDGAVEIKSAAAVWGKDTLDTQEALEQVEGKGSRVLQIGPGGENQVLVANIVNELGHFNGRNGLGAVMGSKNLKAIVVKGSENVPCHDKEFPKDLTRWVAKNLKDHALAYGLYWNGTPGGVTTMNANGSLPTKNWQESVFDKAEDIGAQSLEKILIKRKGCFSCPIRCKRVVESKDAEMPINPALGGPEFETLVCLGSNLGIGDIKLVSKANELCNRYTLDTMSLGMTISFAMECYEKGYLTKEDTGGMELTFGNEEILLELIRMTAYKEGFGKDLALGSYRLSQKLGKDTAKFLLQVKKQEFPAHDPRVKTGLALQYAISSHGADHWVAQHDPFYAEKDSSGMQSVSQLGIAEPVPVAELSARKSRLVYYTHLMTMMYDCLGVCVFGYASRSIVPLEKLAELVEAVTGWNISMWEMLKAGERASVMMRAFNGREGFTSAEDVLPARVYDGISSGPRKGEKLDEAVFTQARDAYYQMAGLNDQGLPLSAKLAELELDWLAE
ncbi:aldehyde ferredoxin oxidoreductase family protein [Dethiobacter alkaliphilus]|uniref:aldehyde ferredoxin oxidoreductase family protein n=1 Tax=Dethiobacter alkaliphilus TaxID=427926 RepID=UPI0022269A9E|nr:aldehyde ferredoxin oxidoreductase family protein [Dethiobacter alkaliphilus]MCW3489412.1 aldehyde ferredoxin oxidoreductase family protein [Dethiobacter alkaliphilus]